MVLESVLVWLNMGYTLPKVFETLPVVHRRPVKVAQPRLLKGTPYCIFFYFSSRQYAFKIAKGGDCTRS